MHMMAQPLALPYGCIVRCMASTHRKIMSTRIHIHFFSCQSSTGHNKEWRSSLKHTQHHCACCLLPYRSLWIYHVIQHCLLHVPCKSDTPHHYNKSIRSGKA